MASPLTFLALSCLGTQGIKNEKITWENIYAVLLGGLVLFFMNWWLLTLPIPDIVNMALYTLTLTAGYICLLMAGVWMSRMLRHKFDGGCFQHQE